MLEWLTYLLCILGVVFVFVVACTASEALINIVRKRRAAKQKRDESYVSRSYPAATVNQYCAAMGPPRAFDPTPSPVNCGVGRTHPRHVYSQTDHTGFSFLRSCPGYAKPYDREMGKLDQAAAYYMNLFFRDKVRNCGVKNTLHNAHTVIGGEYHCNGVHPSDGNIVRKHD